MGNEYLQNAMASFETYKGLADRAVAQISDEQFFATLDAGSNSIAVIIKHVTGNLRSRWTNFLTADGEKPNRNRDAEFEMADSASRSELMAAWEYGWACAFRELKALKPDDLTKTIYIRGEPHSVVKAIGRQLTHGAYHVGQIVLLAKHYADGSWETLTVPRGKSEDLNAEMFSRQTGGSR
ncbi:MAG TPA: DinB family protein [Gemmatimonadaceae bacterium]